MWLKPVIITRWSCLNWCTCSRFLSAKSPRIEIKVLSYVYVLLTKGLWVFVHHVGQVSLPDVKLLHLLLDELRADLLSSCGRHVLPAGGGAQTYPPVENLEGTIRSMSSTDLEPNQARGSDTQNQGSNNRNLIKSNMFCFTLKHCNRLRKQQHRREGRRRLQLDGYF